MQKFLLAIPLLAACSASNADTVSFSLDNVVMTNNQVITGTFDWVFPANDFANGTGTFTALSIPGYGTDTSGLNITIDLTSIEVTLAANLDNRNLDIILRLLTPLSPAQTSALDISQDVFGVYASKYDLTGYVAFTGATGGFVSGSVSAVPVPAAAWLFGSGLLALAGIARKTPPLQSTIIN